MKKIWLATLIIFIVLTILIMPWIIDKIFYTTPPTDFFYTHYEVSDILSYYARVLSLSGTAILGVLTLRQNKIAQEKSEEVNRLQLELQRKSMAIAEEQYAKTQTTETRSITPKFEFNLKGYSGAYSNMRFELKNVSSVIASAITPINLIAIYADNQQIAVAKEMKINARSLSSTQLAIIETVFPELVSKEGTGYNAKNQFYNDIKLIFDFSCEDELSKTYYFRATAFIPTTKEWYNNWEVERVG